MFICFYFLYLDPTLKHTGNRLAVMTASMIIYTTISLQSQ